MARENVVFLKGIVTMIEKDEVNKITTLKMKVIRRNGRIDEPKVILLGGHSVAAKNVEVGNFVEVKGFFATTRTKKTYVCPKCGEKITEIVDSSAIYGINIRIRTGINNLEDFKEDSNLVFLLGPLCRAPKLKTLPSGIKNAQYQMSISRKIRVEGQDEITTDYPFISSLDNQAEEDMKRLEEGSQCYINGGVQTRTITKTMHCNCGNVISVQNDIMEVCPYSTEYLHNCKFDDVE